VLKSPAGLATRFQVVCEVIQEAQGEIPHLPNPVAGRGAAAFALGKLGEAKGGRVRAAKLSPDKRRESARLAAMARWRKEGLR